MLNTLPISLGMSELQVGANLHAALRYLRYTDRERLLWIDALCINQTNDEERCQQVLLMKDIYSKAGEVRIWLGEAAEHNEAAIKIVQDVAGGIHVLSVEYCGKTVTNDDYSALRALLSRSWWSRMWVLQEATLARSAWVHCGLQCVPLETWLDFGTNFQDQERAQAEDCPVVGDALEAIGQLCRDKLAPLNLIKSFKQTWVESAEEPGFDQILMANFLQMLSLGRLLDATDARDKIYGLLGLYHNEGSYRIISDYTEMTANVYTNTAFKIMTLGKTTLPLMFAQRTSTSIPNLPTWVPDWSCYQIGIGNIHALSALWAMSAHFRASNEPLSLKLIDSRVLKVLGVCVDSVESAGEGCRYEYYPFTSDKSVHRAWQKQFCPYFYQKWKTAYVSGVTLEEAFWRTMLQDLKSVENFEAGRLQQQDVEVFRDLWNLTGGTPDEIQEALEERPELEVCLENIYHVTGNRRMVQTSKGYLGLVPFMAEPGDLVFVFAGAPMPYILRPTNDGLPAQQKTYTFIGECYIHGIMDGEATYEDSEGKYAQSAIMKLMNEYEFDESSWRKVKDTLTPSKREDIGAIRRLVLALRPRAFEDIQLV